jgi:hypothetical protein
MELKQRRSDLDVPESARAKARGNLNQLRKLRHNAHDAGGLEISIPQSRILTLGRFQWRSNLLKGGRSDALPGSDRTLTSDFDIVTMFSS